MDKQTEKKTGKAIAKLIDYKKTFATESGSRVLNDLIRTHHVISPVMGMDPYGIVFREGERNVVLRILKVLGTDPDQIKKRIKEIEQDE